MPKWLRCKGYLASDRTVKGHWNVTVGLKTYKMRFRSKLTEKHGLTVLNHTMSGDTGRSRNESGCFLSATHYFRCLIILAH